MQKERNSHGPMICTKCSHPLTNTHLLGGCKYNSKLCTSKHNSTFKLLQGQLENHSGGRWPIVSMDLGNNTVKNFTTQMKVELTTPQEDTTLPALEATQEGLQNDKSKTQNPNIITQKTTSLQTRNHKSHRMYMKHTKTTGRGHDIQREAMPTTHRI